MNATVTELRPRRRSGQLQLAACACVPRATIRVSARVLREQRPTCKRCGRLFTVERAATS